MQIFFHSPVVFRRSQIGVTCRNLHLMQRRCREPGHEAVVCGLKQMFTSTSGRMLAMFIFRRGLESADSAISIMIKLLNDDCRTDEIWHAVVDITGEVIHQHIH